MFKSVSHQSLDHSHCDPTTIVHLFTCLPIALLDLISAVNLPDLTASILYQLWVHHPCILHVYGSHVHPKKKRAHDSILCTFNPQQLHSWNSTVKDEKVLPRAVEFIQQLWTLIHETFHLFKEYTRAAERPFCSFFTKSTSGTEILNFWTSESKLKE